MKEVIYMLEFLSNIFIYFFGICGILIPLIFIFYMLFFRYKKIGPNLHFGYRTKFSLSSKEKWDWSNNTFAQFTFIFAPSFLFIHIIIFILTVVHEWFFLWVILSMVLALIWTLPVAIYIEIYGRKKFKSINENHLNE